MGVLSVAQIQATFKEKILPIVPKLYSIEDTLCSWIKRGQAEKVSDRAMRIALRSSPGGITAGMDYNGGSFPAGTASLFKEAQVTTIGLVHARQLNTKAIWATANKDQAVVIGLANEVAEGMIEFKTVLDKMLQVSNDGVMARIQGVGAAPTYDVAHASNPFGSQLLREGNVYDVYAADLTTLRANGPYYIVQDGGLDYVGKTATTTVAITAGAQHDCFIARGLVSASLAGLPYHINSSASGTWQNLARTAPYVRARSIDAAGAGLSLDDLRRSLNLVRLRKGVSMTKSLTPYCNVQQSHAYEALGIAISEIAKGASTDKLELLFGEMTIAGRKAMENSNADPTKLQWIERSAFGWAVMKDIGDYEVDGTHIFPVYDTTTGVPKAQIWFALGCQMQLFCTDVTNMSYIFGLALPPGY